MTFLLTLLCCMRARTTSRRGYSLKLSRRFASDKTTTTTSMATSRPAQPRPYVTRSSRSISAIPTNPNDRLNYHDTFPSLQHYKLLLVLAPSLLSAPKHAQIWNDEGVCHICYYILPWVYWILAPAGVSRGCTKAFYTLDLLLRLGLPCYCVKDVMLTPVRDMTITFSIH
ncbi:hypothetical protein EDB89DRAFT_1947847 [Lactarius sanguifluus]|nr:hypothetical protein EDB89DRAFT_1947847 [Lactarius sanguifluus]